jgi:hypothetical protein
MRAIESPEQSSNPLQLETPMNANNPEKPDGSASSHCYAAMSVDNIASFSIDSVTVRDNPSEIAEIFGWMKFVATRAECNFSRRQIDYEGVSEIFTAVSRDVMPPRVELKVTRGDDGKVCKVEAVPSA